MVSLALPAVLAVMPLVVITADLATAVTHALLGLAGAAIVLEALMLG